LTGRIVPVQGIAGKFSEEGICGHLTGGNYTLMGGEEGKAGRQKKCGQKCPLFFYPR